MCFVDVVTEVEVEPLNGKVHFLMTLTLNVPIGASSMSSLFHIVRQ